MLAMPVATTSRWVLASSQEECTSAFRPRLSGIHSAAYPHASIRFANAAAAAAVILSIDTQTPSLPSSIDFSSRHVCEARRVWIDERAASRPSCFELDLTRPLLV